MKYYVSNIIACSDYYPFGMVMPDRNGGSNYRYGFQSQESDDEVKGKANTSSYKYRMSDNRLGRFFTVDPLTYSYPHNSPYAFSENRVIDGLELEGLEYISAKRLGIKDETLIKNPIFGYSINYNGIYIQNVHKEYAHGELYYNIGQDLYYSNGTWSTTGDAQYLQSISNLPTEVAPWIAIAKESMGLNEDDDTEEVRKFFKEGAGASFNPTTTAWCSSFANCSFVRSDDKFDIDLGHLKASQANNPASTLNWTMNSRNEGLILLSGTDKPLYGSALVMGNKKTWSGHVGFVVNYVQNGNDITITLLGGNQNDEVNYTSYTFSKSKDGNYYYTTGGGTKMKLFGFAVPENYQFTTDDKFYEYDTDTNSDEGGSTR